MLSNIRTCPGNFKHLSDNLFQWLSDALNTNNHTFEVAPVFILVERALLDYTIRKLGWNNGDGITAPGGMLNIFVV